MALRVILKLWSVKQIANTLAYSTAKCKPKGKNKEKGKAKEKAKGKAKNIGFIGIGKMGLHMSRNLMKKGHKLHIFDVVKKNCDPLKARGAKVHDSATETAKDADICFTMLPRNEQVYDVYCELVSNGVNKKTIFIDSSTIDPSVARNVHKLVTDEGAKFLDAPVSGGVPGAEQGTLGFMVGGTKEEYNTVKPVLKCMGKCITHCGDYGMGQAAKLCNNMMLGIAMIGLSEAMNLAIRLGLNPKTFSDIINSSTGRCWSSEVYNPVPGVIPTAPATKGYDGGFPVDLITKDLGLASGVATASNTPIPMGALAHQIFSSLKARGLGTKDFSIVYEFFKNEKQT